MFRQWRKSRDLKKFLYSLPNDLFNRYGAQDFYTEGQIEKTLEANKYSKEFKEYAQVIFIDEEKCTPELMPRDRYEELRAEIADKYFDGDRNFIAQPLVKRKVGNIGHSSHGNIDEYLGTRD